MSARAPMGFRLRSSSSSLKPIKNSNELHVHHYLSYRRLIELSNVCENLHICSVLHVMGMVGFEAELRTYDCVNQERNEK